jgi:hypothetical protein
MKYLFCALLMIYKTPFVYAFGWIFAIGFFGAIFLAVCKIYFGYCAGQWKWIESKPGQRNIKGFRLSYVGRPNGWAEIRSYR